ncbi:MAG: NAD-dependent epimerase/dehydratase family protein [Planctomyces sp.]|nr:NAD-dependent epimerase/dehydratase family protein [Planctomyces sp.]
MLKRLRRRVTRGMLARMAADAAMVNMALVAALLLRFLVDASSRLAVQVGIPALTQHYVKAYCWNAPLLTIVSLAVFAWFGFYTYGRAYQGKYKALTISGAVLQSFLMFGFATYLLWDVPSWVELPRGALLLAGVFTLVLCLVSRTWTFLWETVIRPEREKKVPRRKQGKNVLVIGGAGYIGSALVPKLLDQGYRVRVLDMFLYGREPLAPVADHERLELIKGDFRHVQEVVTAMEGMHSVIHLGAIVGDPACDLDEKLTLGVNLSATQMIAQVAKARGISKFIFASTCSVYGACDETLDEHSEVHPISLYGHTKLAAEQGLQQMADSNFQPTILRFATIYGLSGRTRFDLVVNLLAARAKMEGVITVHGGDQWRPFVHVDDAALAVATALKAPLSIVGGEIFNVGSDAQNYTISQIGRLVHERVMGADLMIDENSPDKRNYRVSFEKIHRLLNFEPQWTVESGIQQVLEAIAGHEVVDYRDARYSNVKHLKDSGAIDIVRVDDDWTKHLASARAPRDLQTVAAKAP